MLNESKVKFLSGLIYQFNSLTDNVCGSLDVFDRRLQSLEDTVMPVYISTNRMRTLLTNIEKALVISDNVLQFYTLYDKLEDYITQGPTFDIDKYLRSIESLQDAMEFFKKIAGQNIHRSEFDKVNSLLKSGQKKLMTECESIVRRHSQPFDSAYLVQLSSQYNDDQIQKSQSSTIAGEDAATLKLIFNWFIKQHFKFGPVNMYGLARGEMIRKSLVQFQKNFERSSKPGNDSFRSSSPQTHRANIGLISSRLNTVIRRRYFDFLISNS
ncbi:hypothetical protein GJ496_001775 [Pomphorhynchus laevis]|nr:hypothetical protein GJ496_001775 [Pomphorhynchus laevis]